jgi:4'-phosphopantetheinyl transferase
MLRDGEVHIWFAQLPPDHGACALKELLSAAELQEANRFHFVGHHSAYVFAHGILRHVLGAYLACSGADLRFEKNSFGKPRLVNVSGQRCPFSFNMSHSGPLVAVAVVSDRQIGIDVEQIRPLEELMDLAESSFTPPERAFILRHEPGDRQRAFYRCWTRKESFIKAVGKGLSMPLHDIDTSASIVRGPDEGADTWALTELDVPGGYAGALTVEKGFDRLTYFEWSPTAAADVTLSSAGHRP